MVLYVSKAVAGWQIKTEIDRMTDAPMKWARLGAKTSDKGVTAELQLTCFVDKLVGGYILYARLSERMTPGQMGINWRIDKKSPRLTVQ
jgi:hypothetical protein